MIALDYNTKFGVFAIVGDTEQEQQHERLRAPKEKRKETVSNPNPSK